MKTTELCSRSGIITLTKEAFEAIVSSSFYNIFTQFIPFRAEFDYATQCFIYTGCSKDFDLISEGEKIPHYTVQVIENRIRFIKQTK